MTLRAESVGEQKIALGRAIGQHDAQARFDIDPSWLTHGAVIVGIPGVGKSHDIALIAKHLGDTGIAVVILDRTGEHAETLSGLPFCTVYTPGRNLHLSLLTADAGWDRDESIEGAIDTLSHYVQVSFDEGQPLSFLQQKIVGRSLEALHADASSGSHMRISDLMAKVDAYQEEKPFYGLVESRESVISRLRPLTVGAARKVFDSDETLSFETFFGPGIHIIDLSAFKFEHPKDLVSQVVIKRLYRMAKDKGPADYLRQLLIIDEAHHVAPDKGSYKGFLDAMVVENRKYGQGVLVATTTPSQLSQWLLKNISIKVCHLLNDGQDIDLMLRFMVNKYEADRFVSEFMLLDVGEAMVRISTPVHIGPTKVKVAS
jgi:DNA helicase HerA-like ATPase